MRNFLMNVRRGFVEIGFGFVNAWDVWTDFNQEDVSEEIQDTTNQLDSMYDQVDDEKEW